MWCIHQSSTCTLLVCYMFDQAKHRQENLVVTLGFWPHFVLPTISTKASSPPSLFIWDVFVLLQEAAMCSFCSISSTFRRDKPLQLNCTVLWPQRQVKEPPQFLPNTSSVPSWCLRIMNSLSVWLRGRIHGSLAIFKRRCEAISPSRLSRPLYLSLFCLVLLLLVPVLKFTVNCGLIILLPAAFGVRLPLPFSAFMMISIWTAHASPGLTYTLHHSLSLAS